MMHRGFACVVDKRVRPAIETAHAADCYDLAARLAGAGVALVALVEQLKEGHGRCEDGCCVGLETFCPEGGGPVVEVVVADLRD